MIETHKNYNIQTATSLKMRRSTRSRQNIAETAKQDTMYSSERGVYHWPGYASPRSDSGETTEEDNSDYSVDLIEDWSFNTRINKSNPIIVLQILQCLSKRG